MKFKNLLLLLSICLFSTFSSYAEKVDEQRAEKVAKLFFVEAQAKYHDQKNAIEPTVVNKFLVEDAFFVFNFEKGFVIVSAEDRINPIVGYSYTGNLPKQNEWDSNYASFMQVRINQAAYVRENDSRSATAAAEWNKYSNRANLDFSKGRAVEPLFTNLLNQGNPYNVLCPYSQSANQYVPAGCVATAMTMIMYHYRYPRVGIGEKQFATVYGIQYANFGETEYKYENMKDIISPKNPHDMALIQYHCGVSVEMDYHPSGSGAQISKARTSMVQYFKYSTDALYKSKDYYSNTEWTNMMKENLDNEMPLIYGGHEQSNGAGGHAFGCDGYEGNNFHFNFGWSGNGNGNYPLTDVGGFKYMQKAIFNLHPKESLYPTPSNELLEVKSLTGTLTDGSGPIENYDNNYSRSFLLTQPENDSVTRWELKVLDIELAAGDKVEIFDGADDSAPLIKTLPDRNDPKAKIYSTGNKMFVKFTAQGSGKGFYFEYDAKQPTRNGFALLQESAGEFDDFGNGKLYYNNIKYKYYIEPENIGEKKIRIEFTKMDLEPEDFKMHDYIEIQDYDKNVLAVFTGNEIPEDFVTDLKKILVIFKTDQYKRFGGFAANYSITTGVNDVIANNFNVFPNPSKGIVKVDLGQIKEQEIKLSISNCQGQTMMNQNYTAGGLKTINTNHLSSGLYFLSIETTDSKETVKLIIE